MEEAKYSLNIPLPKHEQWEASKQLTIRADHSEELRNSVDTLLGAGTFDRLMAQVVQSTYPPVAPTPSPAAQPGGAMAPATAPPVMGAPANGPCPACGVGSLEWKQRRDGTGSFLGCNNYPNCRYIAKR